VRAIDPNLGKAVSISIFSSDEDKHKG